MRKRTLLPSLILFLLVPAGHSAGARPGESISPPVAVRTVETIRAPDGVGGADFVMFDESLAPALVKVAGWI